MAFSKPSFIVALALLASDVSRADIGCLRDRYYTSASGECCSTDYAQAEYDNRGQLLNVTCGSTTSTLGPDNLPPKHLQGVKPCNGVFSGHDHKCPYGVHASLVAITRRQLISDIDCCPNLRETRDESGVCQWNPLNFSDAGESRAFWEARDRDGCKREGERGACCPDPKHFRNANRECSDKTSRGESLGEEQFITVRRSDGCTDV